MLDSKWSVCNHNVSNVLRTTPFQVSNFIESQHCTILHMHVDTLIILHIFPESSDSLYFPFSAK
jgi:hypothetical protein